MKIPSEIKVAGHTYKVVFEDGLWINENLVGQVQYNKQVIRLEPKSHPEMITAALHHEVLHIIDRHFNNQRLDEDTIDALAEGLFQVLGSMGITFEK